MNPANILPALRTRIRRFRHLLRWILLRGPRQILTEASALWKTKIVLRLLPRESTRIFATTLLLGAACGLVAVAFHGSLELGGTIVKRLLAPLPPWAAGTLLVLLPAATAWMAGVLLVRSGLPAAGSGIPQVKASLARMLPLGGLRVGAAKFALCVLQVGGGASLGREGPTVQICAALVPRFLKVFALPRTLVDRFLPVAAAAGIAAAFNTPIAAVTFTMEELMGSSTPTAMTGLVVAAAIAAIEEKLLLGGLPLFHVPSWGFGGLASLPSFLLLGLCGGFLGASFHRALLLSRDWFGRRTWSIPVRMAVGGLVAGAATWVALVATGNAGVAGPGYALLDSSLHQDLSLGGSATLLPLKFLATLASYASGGIGGIFSPVLAMGSLLGTFVGWLQSSLPWTDATPLGAFALVGMGTFFASVIQAPITSVLIIFELTGNYGLVLPLMLANMASFLVAKRMNPVPIYDALLLQDGIDLQAVHQPAHPTVGDLCLREPSLLAADSRASEAAASGTAMPCILVEADGTCLGILEDLPAGRGSDALLRDLVGSRATLREDAPPFAALALLSEEGRRWIPVVDKRGKPIGLFGSRDALAKLSSGNWRVE